MSTVPITNSSMETVAPNGNAPILLAIQLSYSIPSLALIVALFFLLQFGKSYNNSFYRVVQLDLITNFMLHLNTYPALRLETVPIGVVVLKSIETTLPGFLTVCKFLLNFFHHMQFCSAISLTIHRMSSVVFPTRYDHWWKSWFLMFYFCNIIYSILPVVILFPGLSIQISIVDGVLTKFRNSYAMNYNSAKIGITASIYFVLILGTGLSTAATVRSKMKAINVSDRGVGKKLSKIALTYALLYSGILLWSNLSALNNLLNFLPPEALQYYLPTMTFASDMMTFSLPYIMIVFDTNIRKDVFKRAHKPMHNTKVSSGFLVSTTML